MQRTIKIETSQFSRNPTKRWVGDSHVEESVCLKYPKELDSLDDEDLVELANAHKRGVCYIEPGGGQKGDL